MSTRYYPLYQRGNPQLRVFLPNFWMKLVRSEEPLPPNQVLFQTSIQMTRQDVWNYLEKIYKIPLVDVKIEIKMGPIRRSIRAKRLIKEDDYKEALVTLPKDFKFEFPDVAKDVESKAEMERYKKIRDSVQKAQSENKHRPGVPMLPDFRIDSSSVCKEPLRFMIFGQKVKIITQRIINRSIDTFWTPL